MSSLQASTKYEVDADRFVHLEIGQSTWSFDHILTNVMALYKAIHENLKSAGRLKDNVNPFVSVSISAPFTPAVVLSARTLREELRRMEEVPEDD